jgi:hypothetical protein
MANHWLSERCGIAEAKKASPEASMDGLTAFLEVSSDPPRPGKQMRSTRWVSMVAICWKDAYCSEDKKTATWGYTMSRQGLFSARAAILGLSFFLISSAAQAQAHLPFDLVVEANDINGWPLNPKWGAQVLQPPSFPDPYQCPGLEPWGMGNCTRTLGWRDISDWKCPSTPFNYVWFPGHWNVAGATYTGTLTWQDHSGSDDDYNLNLLTTDNAGLTASNTYALMLEFDSDETIDHFHTSWWSAFHSAVDKGGSYAHAMIDGKEAIAFGVLGLDCVHDCSSELHPVFALAIHVSTDPNDDVWAFFVRNWGNEGYCSSGVEALDDSISSYTFRLPKPNATDVQATTAEFLSRGPDTSVSLDFAPNEGADVTFTFPHASSRERMNGIVHLQWTVAPQPRVIPPRLLTSYSVGLPEQPERRTILWKALMSPAQRAIYERYRPHADTSVDRAAVTLARGHKPRKPVPEPRFVIKPVPDPKRDRREALEMQALKRAYDGKLPAL